MGGPQRPGSGEEGLQALVQPTSPASVRAAYPFERSFAGVARSVTFAAHFLDRPMYAIVDIAGQQYKVKQAQKLKVHRLEAEEGKHVELAKVLLVSDGKTITVG